MEGVRSDGLYIHPIEPGGERRIIYHGSFLMYAMTEKGVGWGGVRVDGTGERLI
jgi:hypothetical protein